MATEEGGRDLALALKDIFRVNFGVRPGEKALVFTDLIRHGGHEELPPPERERRAGLVGVARAAREAGARMGLDVRYMEYPDLGGPGVEPAAELWRLAFGESAVDALEGGGLLDRLRDKAAGREEIERARSIVGRHRGDAVEVVLALANFSTTHTRFRDLLTASAGARYASMPLFSEEMLWGAMGADWAAVADRCDALADALSGAESVRVTTPDGTDISFSITGRKLHKDTGMLREPGTVSNLPAGEVYAAPVEGTGEGVLMLNWAPERRLASPLRVRVEGGMAREVTGDDPYKNELLASFGRRAENANLAELGIGANDRATRPDNILESEKILGTVHMAFGDNSSMGGSVSTPFHQDFVFFMPTLTVKTAGGLREVLREGRLFVG